MQDIERLETQSVDAAIRADWNSAIQINESILAIDHHNEQAILRLAYAYLQQGSYEKAKKAYHKALRKQPKLAVAKQYLERIEILEKGKSKPQTNKPTFDPDLFIETLGKTKSAVLCNLGQKQILAGLYIGEPVLLKIKKRRVEIRTAHDEYIGALPDDLSKRLMLFMKAKSVYTAYIKDVTMTKVVVFIREDKKGRNVSHHLSFPLNIQKNMDQITHGENNPTKNDETEDDDEVDDMSDWEKLVVEATEEKEELLDIQTDDLDEDEEE